MTQTTDYFGGSCGFVQVSSNNSDWTDISNVIDTVEPSEQTWKTGEVYTQEGAYAIITGGKGEPIEVDLKGVYSDTASEGYTVLKALLACNAALYLRWGPSSTSGDPRFSTGLARFSGFQEPSLNASDPVALAWGFKVKCPSITTGTVV